MCSHRAAFPALTQKNFVDTPSAETKAVKKKKAVDTVLTETSGS